MVDIEVKTVEEEVVEVIVTNTPDLVVDVSAPVEITTEINGTGPRGPAGTGVPDGGTRDQILAKVSDNDGDSTWVDLDYNKAINKPMIEGVPLVGNQSFPALHLNALTNQEIEQLISI